MFCSLRTCLNGLTPIKPNTFLLIFRMKKYMWLSHLNILYFCLCEASFAHHCLLLTTVRYSQILFLFRLLKTHPNGLTPIRPNTLFRIRPIKKYMWLSHRNLLYFCLCQSTFAHHCLLLTNVLYSLNLFMLWSFRTYANGLTPIKPNTFLLICPMKKYIWLSNCNLLYLCLCEFSFAHRCFLLTTARYS